MLPDGNPLNVAIISRWNVLRCLNCESMRKMRRNSEAGSKMSAWICEVYWKRVTGKTILIVLESQLGAEWRGKVIF